MMHKGGEDKGAAYFAYPPLLEDYDLPLIEIVSRQGIEGLPTGKSWCVVCMCLFPSVSFQALSSAV